MKTTLIISVVFAIVCFGCGQPQKDNLNSSNPKGEQEKSKPSAENKKALDEVVYRFPKEGCPVVLFFDAQAAGTQFLNQYGDMFKSLGMGIVASNKYRNGISMEEAGSIVKQMIITAQTNGADMNEIYLMGFSGGGKFAQNLAEIIPGTKGVITMGIGKARLYQGKVPEVNIVGINDLNFRYVMKYPLDKKRKYSKPDIILLHEKGHEWAPKEILEYALRYCLNGFQTKNLKLPTQTDPFVNELNILLDQFSDDNQNAREKLEKLTNTSFKKENHWLGKLQVLMSKNSKQKSREALQKLDLEETDEHVKERVKSYFSMLNYMAVEKYIENGSYEKAEYQLKIYKIVDPDNPDINLLKALLLSKQGDYETAVKLIDEVIRQGFSGYQKLIYMNFPKELSQSEDFVLTLSKIYPD